jgi:hypothetical protein
MAIYEEVIRLKDLKVKLFNPRIQKNLLSFLLMKTWMKSKELI